MVILIINHYFLYKEGFDDSDKENLVQIALLAGVFVTLYEARLLREADHKPILALYLKDFSDPKRRKHLPYRICPEQDSGIHLGLQDGRYLVVRNTGRGTAFNLQVSVMETSIQGFDTERTSNTIVAPDGNEVPIEFNKRIYNMNDLDGTVLDLNATSETGWKHTFRFRIESAEKYQIEYLSSR